MRIRAQDVSGKVSDYLFAAKDYLCLVSEWNGSLED